MLSFCVSFLRIFGIILVRVLRVFDVVFFTLPFTRFYTAFCGVFYAAIQTVFSTRFVWAKFRLLQSGKLRQGADRAVSRWQPQNIRVPAHPYEKDE